LEKGKLERIRFQKKTRASICDQRGRPCKEGGKRETARCVARDHEGEIGAGGHPNAKLTGEGRAWGGGD